MVMGQHAFTVYQIVIFCWFCAGVAVVGVFSFRDIFKMFRKNDDDQDSEDKKD